MQDWLCLKMHAKKFIYIFILFTQDARPKWGLTQYAGLKRSPLYAMGGGRHPHLSHIKSQILWPDKVTEIFTFKDAAHSVRLRHFESKINSHSLRKSLCYVRSKGMYIVLNIQKIKIIKMSDFSCHILCHIWPKRLILRQGVSVYIKHKSRDMPPYRLWHLVVLIKITLISDIGKT